VIKQRGTEKSALLSIVDLRLISSFHLKYPIFAQYENFKFGALSFENLPTKPASISNPGSPGKLDCMGN